MNRWSLLAGLTAAPVTAALPGQVGSGRDPGLSGLIDPVYLDASTWMARFPGAGLTIACLSNLSSDSAERRGLAVADRLMAGGFAHPSSSAAT